MRIGLATLLIVLGLGACGYSGQATASPDKRTAAYVALVRGVHDKYVAARGPASDAYNACAVAVDPPNCHDRGVAMIAVWQQFLKDLDATPAPPKFATEDAVIRAHLPHAVDDLRAMVAAAARNDAAGTANATLFYVGEMKPAVVNALGDVSPVWKTE